jgi:shikimate dehydrogenase
VTRRAAVLGHPINHSLSPALHRAGYQALGLDFDYQAIDVTESELPEFLENLDDSWVGLSLTMPLKERITEIVPTTDALVRLTNSANTVSIAPDRTMSLSNTDVYGIRQSVTESLGINQFERILIIGSGATARSAAAACKDLGAIDVVIRARNVPAREQVQQVAISLGMESSSADLRWEGVGDYDLVICTLPSSAFDHHQIHIDQGIKTALLDVAYSPWPSRLATQWPNDAIVSGKEMLLWQATKQFEIFTGMDAPVSAMRSAIL